MELGEIDDLVPHEPFKCATEAICSTPPRGKVLRRPKLDTVPLLCDNSTASGSCYSLDLSQSDNEIVRRITKRATAKIAPLHCSRSVQTDALSIDMEALCPLDDFRRSERINGLRSETNEASRLAVAEAKVQLMQAQIDHLQSQLRGQKHIHDDLKALLIGSLGNDTTAQLQQLSEDRVRLNDENVKLRKEMNALADQLDRVNIEADMWRSKFVAGRVMLDELAGWKAQLFVRYQESYHALKLMLQERQQIRNDLCEIYRVFTTRHPTVAKDFGGGATNSVELAIANRQIARALFKNDQMVNPASPTIRLERCREYTAGERNALDVLRNQPTFSADSTMKYPSAFQTPESKTFECVTLGSCKKCRGEVSVV